MEEVIIYDAAGRLVDKVKVEVNSSETIIDASNYVSGLYSIVLTFSDEIIHDRVVISR